VSGIYAQYTTNVSTAGCIALGLQAFGPVSGNWCWIKRDRLALRYGLGHGWRFSVILGIFVIYVCIIKKLRRQYSWRRRYTYGGHARINTESTDVGQSSAKREFVIPEPSLDHGLLRYGGNMFGRSKIVNLSEGPQSDGLLAAPTAHVRSDGQYTATIHDHKLAQSLLRIESVQKSDTRANRSLQPAFKDDRIRIVAQMTVYPTLYVLLWIPGIVNRGVEASGRTSVALQYLQAGAQLIGLADAIVFAAQQKIWRATHRASS